MLTDQQTINELIQKGMIDFAAEKGNPGAILLKAKQEFSQQKSLDMKGEKNDDGVKPSVSPTELTQLCYLLQHNLIPAESLILQCLFFLPDSMRNHHKLCV